MNDYLISKITNRGKNIILGLKNNEFFFLYIHLNPRKKYF